MTDREKLIELLGQCDGCNAEYCDQCEFGKDIDGCVLRQKEIIADTLLANGVTFATDTNGGGKWIPGTEKLPEDDSNVLACLRIGEEARIYPAYYAKGVWWDCIFNTPATKTTTHWMPLPEPPKEE